MQISCTNFRWKLCVKCLLVTKITRKISFEGYLGKFKAKFVFQRQPFAKYLRKSLVFVWNNALPEKLEFHFSGTFCWYWPNFLYSKNVTCEVICTYQSATNNQASFQLPWKDILLNHQKKQITSMIFWKIFSCFYGLLTALIVRNSINKYFCLNILYLSQKRPRPN